MIATSAAGMPPEARPYLVASALLAPSIDGPRRRLFVAHRSRLATALSDDSGRVVMTLLLPGAIRLPTGCLVGGALGSAAPTAVGDGAVVWGSMRLPVTRWWRPARPQLPSLRGRVDEKVLPGLLGGWPALIGRGEGLTPYGDDVVCGALVALRAADHPAAEELAAAVRESPLEATTTAPSAALLRAACDGSCVDELAAYLADVATGCDASASARRLLAVGATSGAGLREGVGRVLGLSRVRDRAA